MQFTRHGRQALQSGQAGLYTQFSTRLNLERELRNALIKGEFEVFYQPQVSLQTGAITGVEALVRWRHSTRGMVQPYEFLPLAEETGLILQIDEFVQHQA
ncbi:MAG: EAL domain-containing protein, partial [Alphaproteobacteria bacterium]